MSEAPDNLSIAREAIVNSAADMDPDRIRISLQRSLDMINNQTAHCEMLVSPISTMDEGWGLQLGNAISIIKSLTKRFEKDLEKLRETTEKQRLSDQQKLIEFQCYKIDMDNKMSEMSRLLGTWLPLPSSPVPPKNQIVQVVDSTIHTIANSIPDPLSTADTLTMLNADLNARSSSLVQNQDLEEVEDELSRRYTLGSPHTDADDEIMPVQRQDLFLPRDIDLGSPETLGEMFSAELASMSTRSPSSTLLPMLQNLDVYDHKWVRQHLGGHEHVFARVGSATQQLLDWPVMIKLNPEKYTEVPKEIGDNGYITMPKGDGKGAAPGYEGSSEYQGRILPTLLRSKRGYKYIGHYRVFGRAECSLVPRYGPHVDKGLKNDFDNNMKLYKDKIGLNLAYKSLHKLEAIKQYYDYIPEVVFFEFHHFDLEEQRTLSNRYKTDGQARDYYNVNAEGSSSQVIMTSQQDSVVEPKVEDTDQSISRGSKRSGEIKLSPPGPANAMHHHQSKRRRLG